MLVGATADRLGRKPLFLIGLLVLPIRGVLYTFSDNPYWLVSVQLLDGIGAGIHGAIFPVIVGDVMCGTGRFNVAQGAVMTAQDIGAALSTTLAGLVVVHAGYSAAFITLGGVAAIGAVVFFFAMPETRAPGPGVSPSRDRGRHRPAVPGAVDVGPVPSREADCHGSYPGPKLPLTAFGVGRTQLPPPAFALDHPYSRRQK
jgi:MFS family permease